jgi:hypothetical protein
MTTYPSQKQSNGSNRTVGDLANSARVRALSIMTENTFAKMLLTFDDIIETEYAQKYQSEQHEQLIIETSLAHPQPSLEPEPITDELIEKALLVIRKFRTTDSAKEMQLCLLWLAGKGWAGLTLAQLANIKI